MRCPRLIIGLLIIPLLLAAPFFLNACSSGGGGGGGVTYDNSRANGAYTYVVIGGGGGMGVEVGTATFDGAGNGVYSAITSSATGTITYSVTTDNTITIHDPGVGTSIVGTMRSGGSFFVGTDTTNGSEVMIAAVKQSTTVTDSTTTYYSGQFEYNTSIPRSQVELVSIVTASPTSGVLTYENLSSLNTGTFPYLLSTATGTISIPDANPIIFGALSADNALMVYGDGETAGDDSMMGGFAFKLPGSGMTTASMNGTYLLYQFMDDNVGSDAFVTSRSRATFDGAGGGTYSEIANSTGTVDPGGPFTYAVDDEGTFLINGETLGVVIQDGSVFGIIDYDDIDGSVAVMIGVKQ
jgi:hypothetical protein